MTAAFVLAVAPPALSQDKVFLRNVSAAKGAVYRVEDAQRNFLGTAFMVNRYGDLLTCAHVVGTRDTVLLAGYFSISGASVADSALGMYRADFAAVVDTVLPRLDLALLKVSLGKYGFERLSFLPLGNSDHLEEGEDVAICAFIPDTFFRIPRAFVSKGIASTIRSSVFDPKLQDHVAIIQMDLDVAKGTSGGPIFSPRAGAVLGIQNSGVFQSDQSSQTPFAIALSINQIAIALDSLGIPYDRRR